MAENERKPRENDISDLEQVGDVYMTNPHAEDVFQKPTQRIETRIIIGSNTLLRMKTPKDNFWHNHHEDLNSLIVTVRFLDQSLSLCVGTRST